MHKDISLLLFAAGETFIEKRYIVWNATDDEVGLPDFLKQIKSDMSLKHMCREAIRKRLLELEPHSNLFSRIPELGLPSSLQSYLLFHVSLNQEDSGIDRINNDDDDSDSNN